MSLPTISRAIQPFVDDLVLIDGKEDSRGGRKPQKLHFNYQARYLGGIQIERDYYSFVISKLDKKPIVREKKYFDCSNPFVTSLELEKRLIEIQKNGFFEVNQLEEMTIAVTGIVDNEGCVISDAFPQWKGLNGDMFFKSFHSIFTHCETRFENDANTFAIAEYSERDHRSKNIIGIYLGKGIGVGIIIDGQLFRGAHGKSGEIGRWNPSFIKSRFTLEDTFQSREPSVKTEILVNLITSLNALFDPDEMLLSSGFIPYSNAIFSLWDNHKYSEDTKLSISPFGEDEVLIGALALSASRFLKKIVGKQ
jgi:hypothetical protein